MKSSVVISSLCGPNFAEPTACMDRSRSRFHSFLFLKKSLAVNALRSACSDTTFCKSYGVKVTLNPFPAKGYALSRWVW